MAAPQDDWTTVINDVDDATAQLILQWQLEDLKVLEDAASASDDTDQKTALKLFKAELEHHQALRSTSPPPTTEDEQDATNEPPPATAPSPEPSAVVTFPCEACGDRFDADHCWQAPCQHWYCDEDLAQLFRASMTDRALYPPRCCRQVMPFEDVRLFLDQDLAEEFAAKQEELDEKQPTYCYVPTCSTYIGQAHKENTKATCPTCGADTCVLCKQEHHEGDCTKDEAVEQTEELAREQGWQRCIDCRRFVELTIGCNHMTCICRAQFCFVCGSRWRTCTCPHFDENRLLARGRQIADREGRADVAAVVEEVRENHNCNGDHDFDRVDQSGTCDECGDFLRIFIYRCQRCRMLACRRCMDNVL